MQSGASRACHGPAHRGRRRHGRPAHPDASASGSASSTRTAARTAPSTVDVIEQPGAPSARPGGGRRGDGAAEERAAPCRWTRREPNGRRGRPARRHPVHRLVLRHAARTQVTPTEGIARAARRRRTVAGSEGVDRIALQEVGTGKYVTGRDRTPTARSSRTSGATPARRPSSTSSTGAQGVVTLRSAANGKYVGCQRGRLPSTTRPSPTAGSCSSSSSWRSSPTAPTCSATRATRPGERLVGPNPTTSTVDRRRRHARLGATTQARPPASRRRSSAAASTRPRRRRRAPTRRSSWSAACPFINGREDHDRDQP